MKERITLALATYNQADLLREFLERYRRFGFGKTPLLVVDDGSTDATPDLLGEAEKSHTLRRLRVPHGGSAHARNEALRRCQTEWIAFSDTDCVLDEAYFELVEELPYRFGGCWAVEGAVIPPPGPKPPFTHSLFNAKGGTYATANMAFRKSPVLDLGGFDENFPANLREDTDLALTLLERLGPIPFWPEWIVCHPHVPRKLLRSLAQAWSRHDQMLRAELRLHQKHPDTYRLVRRHASAEATLRNWSRHWSWLYLRECGAYLAALRGAGPAQWLSALFRCAEAALVAGLEHMCIAAWCLFWWKPVKKARTA